jgi:HSP20 family molecular chaperone IbpA
LANLISSDEIKRLQKRMNKLMQDLGLTDLESKYLDEMQKIQTRLNEIMTESDVAENDFIVPLADVRETDESVIVCMDLPGVDKKDVERLKLRKRATTSANVPAPNSSGWLSCP